MSRKSRKSRPKARRCAMQAVYQWQMTGNTPEDVIVEFVETHNESAFDFDYFTLLFNGVVSNKDAIDNSMRVHLDRDILELNPVELAVLRVAVYEFQHCPDVPYKVVINEAINIAKEFGADQGHKYINAVLDALAPECRPAEADKKNR